MKIAVDGGAFQQGIAAGLYNVAVGLLNEMARIAPNISFVFVTDPRFGPARKELLQVLNFVPEIVAAPVCPSLRAAGQLTSKDPFVAFEIDGRIVPAESDGTLYRYRGAPPLRSARVHSRVGQPSANGSMDARHLGLGVREICVTGTSRTASIAFDDPRLADGFHSPDDFVRWTKGPARLPQELFVEHDGDVTIEVLASGNLDYNLNSVASKDVSDAVFQAKQKVEIAVLEKRLIELGCTAYLANHFIPISLPCLRNYAILYDVAPVKFPEFFLGDARDNFEHVMRVFQQAMHTFSISEASRKELLSVADISPERVSTVLIDVDPLYKPVSAREIADVKARYGLTNKPYILCVGTIEPRKNHLRLLRAFRVSRAQSTHALVVVGKRGWGTESFFSELEHNPTPAEVHVLSNVPTEDLPMLYGGAAFLAYPSLYEGFGLPIVEAMACGCPVLTSNRSSMAEIANGAAVLVDPTQTTSIAEGIGRLALNVKLQDELRQKGLERRQWFSWTKSARRIVEILHA